MDHGGVVHLQIPAHTGQALQVVFGGQIDGNLPGQGICWIRLRDRICWPVMLTPWRQTGGLRRMSGRYGGRERTNGGSGRLGSMRGGSICIGGGSDDSGGFCLFTG